MNCILFNHKLIYLSLFFFIFIHPFRVPHQMVQVSHEFESISKKGESINKIGKDCKRKGCIITIHFSTYTLDMRPDKTFVWKDKLFIILSLLDCGTLFWNPFIKCCCQLVEDSLELVILHFTHLFLRFTLSNHVVATVFYSSSHVVTGLVLFVVIFSFTNVLAIFAHAVHCNLLLCITVTKNTKPVIKVDAICFFI